jgi:hypothetical protein
MKMHEFGLLDIKTQLDILYTNGVYVGKRRKLHNLVLLYQLESFYVEVFYKKYRYFVDHVNCSESVDLVEPYLDQIKIEQLVT